MTAPDPVTIGELSRQLSRMETSIGREIRDVKDSMSGLVPRELFDSKLAELRADLADLESDVEAHAVTRRQFVVSILVIIVGEIIAIMLALSNLSARVTGG